MLHRTKLLLLIIIIFASAKLLAQGNGPWEIGLGIGYTNYYGDLSPYKINGIRNLYRIADFNRYYQDRPSFSLMVHRKLTPTLGFMVQANYLQFGMSDRYRNKAGNIDSTVGNYSRALNFQTSVKDIGLAFTFNANNGRVFAKDAFFYPSFYLGAGVSQFTVKGDLYDANNNPYNYLLPGNINDGSFETNLRDLRTETESKYPDIEPYVNLGLALNFRFSNRFSLAVQSDIKYSASDYLDDVSRRYKTTYPSAAESYAARPGYNVVDPVTRARGDDNGMNDFYINNRIVLHVGLGGKPKPAPFTAPVIYTLAPPYRAKKAVVDSVRIKAVADSLLKLKNDSLFKAKLDSVKYTQDSIVASAAAVRENDSLIKSQLQAINAELSELKSAMELQKNEPVISKMELAADSIKSLRQKISSQKKVSQEDNLRLRIYDFQLDSINREISKVQPVTKNQTTGTVSKDTVTDSKEIREFSQEVTSLKKDERYKTDTAFRKNVDLLQTRLDSYREQAKKDAAAEKARGRNSNERIDSLQTRIKYLESVNNTQSRSDETTRNTDTIKVIERRKVPEETVVVRDTTTRRRYEPVTTDTVTVKKKWYQRLFSTGPKKEEPEEVKEETKTSDTTTVKRKWYQRLFSTGPKKDNAVVEERVSTDTVVRTSPSRDEKNKVITDTVTRKRKWYQRLFSTGPKDTLQRSSSVEPSGKRTDYVSGNRQPATPARDTVIRRSTTVQNAPVRRSTVVLPVRDTVVSGRLARVDPATVKDTVELKKLMAESEQVRRQNEAAVAQLREQLKRSSDSAAFYRSALVQASEVKETPAETPRRSIFTSRRKQEEETRQREADEQAARDQYLYQQRYQSGQVSQLQRRIDDLETDNRNLSRYQDNYNSEIRRRNYVDYGTTTAVVAGAAISASDNREMASIREELNRLKSQVNTQDQRLKTADSTAVLDSIRRAAYLATPLIAPDTANKVRVDSTQITALKSEIDLLKEEIVKLKTAPAAVSKSDVAEAPGADLSAFPVVSVYFNSGSVALSAEQAAKLRAFAQAASTNKKANILLKGFADATGNLAVNKKLAMQRMEAVKNQLLSKYQVSMYRITTDEPQIAGGSGAKKSNPLDRRVDLQFQ